MVGTESTIQNPTVVIAIPFSVYVPHLQTRFGMITDPLLLASLEQFIYTIQYCCQRDAHGALQVELVLVNNGVHEASGYHIHVSGISKATLDTEFQNINKAMLSSGVLELPQGIIQEYRDMANACPALDDEDDDNNEYNASSFSDIFNNNNAVNVVPHTEDSKCKYYRIPSKAFTVRCFFNLVFLWQNEDGFEKRYRELLTGFAATYAIPAAGFANYTTIETMAAKYPDKVIDIEPQDEDEGRRKKGINPIRKAFQDRANMLAQDAQKREAQAKGWKAFCDNVLIESNQQEFKNMFRVLKLFATQAKSNGDRATIRETKKMLWEDFFNSSFICAQLPASPKSLQAFVKKNWHQKLNLPILLMEDENMSPNNIILHTLTAYASCFAGLSECLPEFTTLFYGTLNCFDSTSTLHFSALMDGSPGTRKSYICDQLTELLIPGIVLSMSRAGSEKSMHSWNANTHYVLLFHELPPTLTTPHSKLKGPEAAMYEEFKTLTTSGKMNYAYLSIDTQSNTNGYPTNRRTCNVENYVDVCLLGCTNTTVPKENSAYKSRIHERPIIPRIIGGAGIRHSLVHSQKDKSNKSKSAQRIAKDGALWIQTCQLLVSRFHFCLNAGLVEMDDLLAYTVANRMLDHFEERKVNVSQVRDLQRVILLAREIRIFAIVNELVFFPTSPYFGKTLCNIVNSFEFMEDMEKRACVTFDDVILALYLLLCQWFKLPHELVLEELRIKHDIPITTDWTKKNWEEFANTVRHSTNMKFRAARIPNEQETIGYDPNYLSFEYNSFVNKFMANTDYMIEPKTVMGVFNDLASTSFTSSFQWQYINPQKETQDTTSTTTTQPSSSTGPSFPPPQVLRTLARDIRSPPSTTLQQVTNPSNLNAAIIEYDPQTKSRVVCIAIDYLKAYNTKAIFFDILREEFAYSKLLPKRILLPSESANVLQVFNLEPCEDREKLEIASRFEEHPSLQLWMKQYKSDDSTDENLSDEQKTASKLFHALHKLLRGQTQTIAYDIDYMFMKMHMSSLLIPLPEQEDILIKTSNLVQESYAANQQQQQQQMESEERVDDDQQEEQMDNVDNVQQQADDMDYEQTNDIQQFVASPHVDDERFNFTQPSTSYTIPQWFNSIHVDDQVIEQPQEEDMEDAPAE